MISVTMTFSLPQRVGTLLAFCLCCAVCSGEAHGAKLKKRAYLKHSDTKSVVLMNVNWGRAWGCGRFENAQLLELQFELINARPGGTLGEDETIIAKSGPSLLAAPEFKYLGFLVDPGVYAFTAWKIRVSESLRSGGELIADKSKMVDGDDYLGGTFKVAPGEVIYIGHFALDCTSQPIPWRYFMTGQEGIEALFANYRKEFKYLEGAEITYRLLETENFGSSPAMMLIMSGNSLFIDRDFKAAIAEFEQALALSSPGDDRQETAIAMYGLGRAHGHACDFETAESWFERSIEIRAELPDTESAHLSQNYFELARLYVSRGRWPQAREYYDLAFSALDSEKLLEDDPQGYVEVLQAYLEVLQNTDEIHASGELVRKIEALKRAHGEADTIKFQPYPKDCTT